jgi:hypothetical protein
MKPPVKNNNSLPGHLPASVWNIWTFELDFITKKM